MFLYEIPNNKGIAEAISLAISSIFSYLAHLNWELIMIWLIIASIDILTGILASFKQGNHASNLMSKGLYRKVGEFMLIVAVVFVQRVLEMNGISIPCDILIVSFILKEVLSVIENSIVLNVKIPESIKNFFQIAEKTLDGEVSKKLDNEINKLDKKSEGKK